MFTRKYDNYTYIGWNPVGPEYSDDEVNKLIAKRDYASAIDYLKSYHWNDSKKQEKANNYIRQIREQDRLDAYLYKDVDKTTMDYIDFYQNVLLDGGLENLSNDNIAKQKFIEAKRKIGSVFDENGKILTEATSLRIAFAPKNRTNAVETLENLCTKLNLTEDDLRNKGIEIEKTSSGSSIKFDKDNALANSILLNTLQNLEHEDFHTLVGSRLISYDQNGHELHNTRNRDKRSDNPKANIRPSGLRMVLDPASIIASVNDDYTSYSKMFTPFAVPDDAISDIKSISDSMKTIYAAGENFYNRYNQKTGDESLIEYSSIVGSFLDDDSENLRQTAIKEGWDSKKLNDALNKTNSNLYGRLKSLTLKQYPEVYSNFDSDDDSLVPIDTNDGLTTLNALINHTENKDIILQSFTSGGKIGTLITFEGLSTQKDKKTDQEELRSGDKTIQIFVPDLFHEEASAALNRNSLSRAYMELNNLKDYANYNFDINANTHIECENNNYYLTTDKTNDKPNTKKLITKEEAIRHINKTFMLEDAESYIYKFINANNELDTNLYSNACKRLAFQAINELYGDVFYDNDNIPFDINDLFNPDNISKLKNTFNKDTNEAYIELLNFYSTIYNRGIQIYDKINNAEPVYSSFNKLR